MEVSDLTVEVMINCPGKILNGKHKGRVEEIYAPEEL